MNTPLYISGNYTTTEDDVSSHITLCKLYLNKGLYLLISHVAIDNSISADEVINNSIFVVVDDNHIVTEQTTRTVSIHGAGVSNIVVCELTTSGYISLKSYVRACMIGLTYTGNINAIKLK